MVLLIFVCVGVHTMLLGNMEVRGELGDRPFFHSIMRVLKIKRIQVVRDENNIVSLYLFPCLFMVFGDRVSL